MGYGAGHGAHMTAVRHGAATCLVACLATTPAAASDHLDTPTVIADPAADIGDLFAWTSADGKRVNLAMTLVAHELSDRLWYVFHVDSGPRFGTTTATLSIACRRAGATAIECWAGDADYVRGDASAPAGLVSQRRRFRVFAGLRDDPFFNNVKGTRAALNTAAAALQAGATIDPSGCARLDTTTSHTIFDHWRRTSDGPAANLLAGWTSASLVLEIDLALVTTGGPMLAVWAGSYQP